MANHNDFGKEAEEKAVGFLKEKNYTILKRNWRFQKAEVDIIAKDESKNEIVIVEVKARINPMVEIETAITKKKKNLLVMAADEFINSNQIELETRFDLILIEKNNSNWEIEHIEDAFFAFE